MTGPRHIYAKPNRRGCNYFSFIRHKINFVRARIRESQEILQTPFMYEEWRIYQQKGWKALENCKISDFLSEILSGGTSWKRNKLVNCGDKIQVGTVTVKPLYFIGLNDQCSLGRWYSCITFLPQIDSIYWPIPPLKKQLQSSKHLWKW